MSARYFAPVNTSDNPKAVNVLTIAEVFPSLIQPWLINHLIQIHKHGGENRIICAKSETDCFSDAISRYELLDKYIRVPSSKAELGLFAISHLNKLLEFSSEHAIRKEWSAHGASTKQMVSDMWSCPAFSVEADVIHSHIESMSSRFVRLIAATKKPFVMTFHGLTPIGVPNIDDAARKRITEQAEVIFANTEFAKNQYVALGAPQEKFKIIPQGIDLSSWDYRPLSYSGEEPLRVLTVGRFHVDKGHKYALQAIKMLKDKGVDVRYTMAGNGPDRERLEQHVAELGLESNVTIKQKLSDQELRDLYHTHHIFVLPSLRDLEGFHEETQAVVIQEAQASGLITIATKTGGIPECVNDGDSAFLVADRDGEAIAEVIDQLLNRVDEWDAIRLRAKAWVKEYFCSDYIGAKMNEVYRDLL